MLKINRVAIIGANGTMGTNVSAIFASFGRAKVYMVSRSAKASQMAVERAAQSIRADSIKQNMISMDYSQMQEAVSQADLVFESVTENLEIKQQITQKIGTYARKDAIICSGTSGLSISELAQMIPAEKRKNYFGVHMFNPPYVMTLCEVTPTHYSDVELLDELEDYLKKILLRTVVRVKDSPAFLGNRIGFQFINSAMRYAEIYQDNGGIDYIDAILGTFTGRAMPPIATADFVGLDIHRAIVDNLYKNTHDFANKTFKLPDYVQDCINLNRLGRKSGIGLFQIENLGNGVKKKKVYDIKTGQYRDMYHYKFPYAEEMRKNLYRGDYKEAFSVLLNNHSQEAEICLQFMLKYIVYSLYAANEVGYDIKSCDHVMATGFNWCPPIAMLDAFNAVTDVNELFRTRLNTWNESQLSISGLLNPILVSDYDYRPFFKSGL